MARRSVIAVLRHRIRVLGYYRALACMDCQYPMRRVKFVHLGDDSYAVFRCFQCGHRTAIASRNVGKPGKIIAGDGSLG